MGARVERWEEQKRLRRAARAAAFGDRRARSELDAYRAREVAKLNEKAEPPNPLGRDQAEIAELYREQRIERTLAWLRGMAVSSGTHWW